jgi:hypothetical protein
MNNRRNEEMKKEFLMLLFLFEVNEEIKFMHGCAFECTSVHGYTLHIYITYMNLCCKLPKICCP